MVHRRVIVPLVERRRWAGLARNPRCRSSRHTAERPCEWFPEGTATQLNPAYNFTGPGSWAFLADYLESSGDIYTITLEKPPGRIAYVIFLPPTAVWRGLYIKFEAAGPGLYGRSFHHPKHPALVIE